MSGAAPLKRLPSSVLFACGALSLCGMSMLMAGVVAMTQPALLPALAKPAVAWPLIAVGGMLETAAMTMLLGAMRARRHEVSNEP